MDEEAREFRESVRQRNDGKSSGRRHFTKPQRSAAVRYLLRRRAEGASAVRIAVELGVGKTTLERWRTRESSFVQVESVATPGSGVSLVSPRGYRLEGLRLEEAIELLSRLG